MRDRGSGGASGGVRQLGWLALCALFLPAALGEASPASAVKAPEAFEVRSILTGEFGFARPIGLTYIRKKNVLLVAKAVRGRTRVLAALSAAASGWLR